MTVKGWGREGEREGGRRGSDIDIDIFENKHTYCFILTELKSFWIVSFERIRERRFLLDVRPFKRR